MLLDLNRKKLRKEKRRARFIDFVLTRTSVVLHDDDVLTTEHDGIEVQVFRECAEEFHDIWEQETCCICLEDFKVNNRVAKSCTGQCKHSFHLECTKSWFKQVKEDTCPMFRAKYV